MKDDALNRLFETYYNDALLYSLTLTRDKSEAEALVAEAFFKAVKKADDEIVNFKAWLLTVCRNTYFNLYRERKKRRELTEAILDEREHVLDKIIREEEYQALYRAIDLLPVHYREVITLFYYEEMKIREIADITGKTELTVRVTLSRARDKIKDILEVKR